MSPVAKRVRTRHPGIYTRGEGRRKRFIVWYEDSNKRGRTETLPLGSTEGDALARQAELRGKRARGERVVPTKLTLAEWLDLWIAEQSLGSRLKPTTIHSYTQGAKRIKDRMGARQLRLVDVDAVARLVADLQEDYKAWTIRGTLVVLSRAMNTAQRRGYVAANPVLELDKHERPKGDQRQMRILSSDEIEKVLPIVTDGYRDLITTLVFTGMRISEALAIEWGDVDFDAGLIHVREGKTENATRSIVMFPSLASVLRRHMVSTGRRAGHVFTTRDRRKALRALQTALERAGVEKFTLHELRHTYASILIGMGMDVTFVADQLGHSDPSVTLRTYAKLFDPESRRDDARERLQVAFGEMIA